MYGAVQTHVRNCTFICAELFKSHEKSQNIKVDNKNICISSRNVEGKRILIRKTCVYIATLRAGRYVV